MSKHLCSIQQPIMDRYSIQQSRGGDDTNNTVDTGVTRQKNEKNQTLKQLDRKLDKIHQDLAQVSRSQQTSGPPREARPSVWSVPPHNLALTYELTPSTARVVFRILDPVFIQWNHVDQSIIVKTPRRYVAKPVWRNSRGQVTQSLAHARDYANF